MTTLIYGSFYRPWSISFLPGRLTLNQFFHELWRLRQTLQKEPGRD